MTLSHDVTVAAMSRSHSINIPWNRVENVSFDTVQHLTELFLYNDFFFEAVDGCTLL